MSLPINALLDTGAGGVAFMHQKLVQPLKKYLKPQFKHLTGSGIAVTGYNNKSPTYVKEYFIANLVIDDRRMRCPFVIADLGKHDVFIGRKWFEGTGALLDCRNRRLIWPPDDLPNNFNHDLIIPSREYGSHVHNKDHQADVDDRDRRFNEQIIKSLQPKPRRRRSKGNMIENSTVAQSTIHSTPPDKELANQISKGRASDHPLKSDSSDQDASLHASPTTETDRHQELSAEALLDEAVSISVFEQWCHAEELLPEEDELDNPWEGKETELLDLLSSILPTPSGKWSTWADITLKSCSENDANTLPPRRPGVDHRIELTSEALPSTVPLYPMSLEHLDKLKAYIEDGTEKGFIVPSSANYGSPVLYVKKPGGGWRLCVDYRRLNAVTKKDKYPIPLIQETLTRLAKAKCISKVDIRQAFHRIRMAEEAEPLTTFRTRYGAYQYRVLPFGLCNGPASFQRYINLILTRYLDKFCTAYLDDILIYSDSEEEHEEHVYLVIKALEDACLQIDPKKSEFNVTSVKFLGFIVSTDGVRMDPDKVSAIRDWPEPQSLKSLQSFLGFCNFYRTFVKDFGRIARPLTKLLRMGAWHKFEEIEKDTFAQLKLAVLSDQVLALYNPGYLSKINTDASDGVLAGVFSQLQPDGRWKPIAFWSKTMDTTQMNYEIHDKEMLAVVEALKEWRSMLIGLQVTPFTIYTDHRALEYFTTKRLLNQRQARWQDTLAEFHFQITHIPGSANIVADVLTRKQEELTTQKAKDIAARTRTLISPYKVIDTVDIYEITEPVGYDDSLWKSFDLVDTLLTANRTSKTMDLYRNKTTTNPDFVLHDNGLLTYRNKLVIPEEDFLRTQVIKAVHATQVSCHPGKNKTRLLVKEKYWWPSLIKDVDRYVANCRPCRWSTRPRDKTPGLLHPLPIPERPWQHISMDFKQFPPDRTGYDNVFVAIDRMSKRAFSLPCNLTATAKDAANLYYQYIWRIYGNPETITSDRGPQFISTFMDELCTLTGVKQKLSTAYHAQTDGQTENINQWIDQRLRPFVNYFQDNWSDLLPCMDFAQAILPHESTGFSPAQIDFGHNPRLHWDWEKRTTETSTPRELANRQEAQQWVQEKRQALEYIRKQVRDNLTAAQARQSRNANRHRRDPDFHVGDYVYVDPSHWNTGRPSRKLDQQMRGPFLIKDMKGHSYELELPEHIKVNRVFHAEKLRKAAMDPLPGQELPPEEPTMINDELEYEVDEILDCRTHYGKVQYRVSWKGYDPDDQWHYASGFKNAPHKLLEFHKKYPTIGRHPKQLKNWLKAKQEEVDAKSDKGDDLPAQRGSDIGNL